MFCLFHYRSATAGSWPARYRYKKNLKKLPGRRQLSKQVALTSLSSRPGEVCVREQRRLAGCPGVRKAPGTAATALAQPLPRGEPSPEGQWAVHPQMCVRSDGRRRYAERGQEVPGSKAKGAAGERMGVREESSRASGRDSGGHGRRARRPVRAVSGGVL